MYYLDSAALAGDEMGNLQVLGIQQARCSSSRGHSWPSSRPASSPPLYTSLASPKHWLAFSRQLSVEILFLLVELCAWPGWFGLSFWNHWFRILAEPAGGLTSPWLVSHCFLKAMPSRQSPNSWESLASFGLPNLLSQNHVFFADLVILSCEHSVSIF